MIWIKPPWPQKRCPCSSARCVVLNIPVSYSVTYKRLQLYSNYSYTTCILYSSAIVFSFYAVLLCCLLFSSYTFLCDAAMSRITRRRKSWLTGTELMTACLNSSVWKLKTWLQMWSIMFLNLWGFVELLQLCPLWRVKLLVWSCISNMVTLSKYKLLVFMGVLTGRNHQLSLYLSIYYCCEGFSFL